METTQKYIQENKEKFLNELIELLNDPFQILQTANQLIIFYERLTKFARIIKVMILTRLALLFLILLRLSKMFSRRRLRIVLGRFLVKDARL